MNDVTDPDATVLTLKSFAVENGKAGAVQAWCGSDRRRGL
jgi:hypothetical protein